MRPKPLIPTLTAMCRFSLIIVEAVGFECLGFGVRNQSRIEFHQTHDGNTPLSRNEMNTRRFPG
jgi:hypothetical protein